MRRKLVKQGAATMMVSLPSKWIKANKLDKGDEIELEERGKELVIGTEKTKKEQAFIEINLTSLTESSIRTAITNTYRLGFDRIKLNFLDEKSIKIIQDTINKNLIGFEIIKKSDKFAEIENITEPSPEQFENIFSKIFLNIDYIFETAEKMLAGQKQDFEETERKIQQFDNFCRRIIAKNNYLNYQLRWAFHTELIHAQREVYHLLKYLEKNKIKSDNELISLFNECKKSYEILKKAYTEKTITSLEKLHELEKEIVYKKGYSYFKKNKNNILAHHLISASRNFYLASSPLIGLIISGEERVD